MPMFSALSSKKLLYGTDNFWKKQFPENVAAFKYAIVTFSSDALKPQTSRPLHDDLCEKYGLAKENNTFFTLHLPEGLDLGHFIEPVRQGYLDYMKNTLIWAAEAGISVLNMHMNQGIYFTLPDEKVYLYDKFTDLYRRRFFQSIDIIAPLIEDKNLIMCVENTGIFDNVFISSLLDELLSTYPFKLTWDTGHDASANYGDRAFIMAHQSSIKHFHLHDARGTSNHLPLFTGEIAFDEYFEIAKQYKCTCVIETKTKQALKASVSKLSRIS